MTMEILKIDVLNPKAKSLLQNLTDLKLIQIQKDNVKSEFKVLLDILRMHSAEAHTLDEITKKDEDVRKVRYEK